MRKNGFTQLPNRLVFDNKNGSMLSIHKDQILIITIIGINSQKSVWSTEKDISCISVSSILKLAGYPNNQRNVKSVKECLQFLYLNKFITCVEEESFDFMKIGNDSVIIESNLFESISGNKTKYFKLFNEDYSKIMELDKDIRIKLGVLTLYCFYASTVKCITGYELGSHGCSYHSYSSISESTGLSRKSITEYISILTEMNLIKTSQANKHTKNYTVKSSPLYVMLCNMGNAEFIDDSLKCGVNQYNHALKNDGWKMVKK